jgi:fucose permease
MKSSIRQTIAYFAAYFLLGAIMASLGPTLPILAENVGVTLASMGMIFSARSFGYLSGALLGGPLYDRFKGNLLLGFWGILSALALWVVPSAGVFAILAGVLFVVGLSQGATDVGCNTQLSRVHHDKVAPYLNAMFFFAGLGSFLIPLLIGKIRLDWAYQGLALALMPVAVWLFWTPSPKSESKNHTGTGQASIKIFVLFALLAFIFVGSEVSFGGWIFSYHQATISDSSSTGYMLNSLFYLAIMLGRLLAILLAAIIKPQRLIWIYLWGAVLSVFLMSLVPSQPWSIWLGTAGMGLSLAAIFPTTFSYVGKKTQLSGKQNGFVWAAGSLGAMIIPWGIGKSFDFQGFINMMSILLIFWLFALGLFLMLTRIKSQRTGNRTR